MKGVMKQTYSKKSSPAGFMLIEVLIALALFGLSAVFLVDGAFVASKAIRNEGYSRNGAGSTLGKESNI